MILESGGCFCGTNQTAPQLIDCLEQANITRRDRRTPLRGSLSQGILEQLFVTVLVLVIHSEIGFDIKV